MNIDEIEQRINPQYADCPGTESHERKWLCSRIRALEEDLRTKVDSAVADEREACAKLLEMRESELLLMAGEMTAQELRTARAVLSQRARAIRQRGNE